MLGVFLVWLPGVIMAQHSSEGSLQMVSAAADGWQRELYRLMRGGEAQLSLAFVDSVLGSREHIEIVSRSEQGVVARLRGDRPGRRIALRAVISPMDAMQKAPHFVPQRGQLLGWHHAESALLLGAAKMLELMQGSLRGDVYFIFEMNAGKGACESAEVLARVKELQRVEAVCSMALEAEVPDGSVGILPEGVVSPTEDYFKLLLYGREGDGATPERCADALVAGAALVGVLQTLVSRGAAPHEATVVNVGKMAAGESARLVAGQALLEGAVYTHSIAERKRVELGIREQADGIAKAYGVAVRCDYVKGPSPLRNDGKLIGVVQSAAVKAVGKNAVRQRGSVNRGETLSCYASVAPLCLFTIGAGDVSEVGATPYVPLTTMMGALKAETQLILEFLERR